MLSLLQIYIQSVVGHMVTILAGCAATVALDLALRFYRKRGLITEDWPDGWRLYMMLAFLCFASFQAWEDQYRSNVGRQTDLHKQEGLTRDAGQNRDQCESDLSADRKVIDLYSGNIFRNQSTLNSCVVALGALKEPLKLTTNVAVFNTTNASGERRPSSVVVSLTNQPVNASGVVTCNGDFRLYGGDIPGVFQPNLRTPFEYTQDGRKIHFSKQAQWDKGIPLVFMIASLTTTPVDSCSVSLN